MSGACGVPADARAVAVNATVVNAGDVGNLRLYPAGAAAPLSSRLNFVAGRTRANDAIVPLGVGGGPRRAVRHAGRLHRQRPLRDVYGYFK